MYSRFQLAYKFFLYYFEASSGKGHGIHSPFVFEFITKILNDRTDYPRYQEIEILRKKLLVDKTLLSIEDFGAGSSSSKSNHRTVSSIAKNAAKPKKFGQLLYRMVQYYKPDTIIEMGTSLGITTCYLASGNSFAKVITLEGAEAIAQVATKNFDLLKLKNIGLIKGNFDITLQSILTHESSIDFVFIDGNHRYAPTINYFNQLLSKSNNSTIFVFDDIHWSTEMEQAWDEIKNNSSVTCTIDLFFIGIVLFKKEIKEKQHFKIRF